MATKEPSPLRPDAQLLVKLGSLIVHAQEAASPGKHPFDEMQVEILSRDPSVVAWLAAMDERALLPVKRVTLMKAADEPQRG